MFNHHSNYQALYSTTADSGTLESHDSEVMLSNLGLRKSGVNTRTSNLVSCFVHCHAATASWFQ